MRTPVGRICVGDKFCVQKLTFTFDYAGTILESEIVTMEINNMGVLPRQANSS